MSEIKTNNWMGRLEEMWDQLAMSWPKSMNTILEQFKHENKNFYIYTFTKWNTHIIPCEYRVYHQPRHSIPDAFPGTILRRISPSQGWAKILWVLPHQEGFDLYKKGKMFSDPLVNESIRRYKEGTLDKMTEDQDVEKYEKV